MALFSTTSVGGLSDVKSAITAMLLAKGWSNNGGIYDSQSLMSIRIADPVSVSSYQHLNIRIGSTSLAGDVSAPPYASPQNANRGSNIPSHVSNASIFPGTLYLYYRDTPNIEVAGVINYGERYHHFMFGEFDVFGSSQKGIFFNFFFGDDGSDGGISSSMMSGSNSFYEYTCDDGYMRHSWNYSPFNASFIFALNGNSALNNQSRSASLYPSCAVYMNTDLGSSAGNPTYGDWAYLNCSNTTQPRVVCPWVNMSASAIYSDRTGFPQLNSTYIDISPYTLSTTGGSNSLIRAGEIAGYKLCNINNVSSGEIITYGSDQWQVWPLWKKESIPADDNWYSNDHSGYVGIAILL